MTTKSSEIRRIGFNWVDRLILVITMIAGLFMASAIFWGCQSSDSSAKTTKKGLTQLAATPGVATEDSVELRVSLMERFDLGVRLVNQGKFPEALDIFQKLLDAAEKIGDENLVARIYNAIGTIYAEQNQDNLALENYLKSLAIREKILDKDSSNTECQIGRAGTLNNIGMIFADQDNYEKAIVYGDDALKIAEKLKDKNHEAIYCNNLGNRYRQMGDYRNAYLYLDRSLKLRRELGDKLGEAYTLFAIGMAKKTERKFRQAIANMTEAVNLAKGVEDRNLEAQIYADLAKTYAEIGTHAKAYEFHRMYSELKEDMVNEESTKQIAEMQTKYETGKKIQQINLLNVKVELQDAEVARKNTWIIIFVVGIVIAVFFIYWFFRGKKKEQRDKLVIAGQHKEIKDSVNYAVRIQRAMLPKLEDIKKAIPESFVYYQPKDVVSGDFYWFHSIPALNKEGCPKDGVVTFIAACDCTGHGVPGALTSAFCSTALDEAIKVTQNPAEILEFANRWVKRALKQSGGEVKDGMDIALVKIEKTNEGAIIHYAGANRPLWIARHQAEEIEQIKADKNAIGGYTEDDYRFTLKTITLATGESFFISSDGFADQFGGPNDKKITTKALKERLLMIRYMTAEAQKENITSFMANWMPDPKEQVDDFLVIGVKIV